MAELVDISVPGAPGIPTRVALRGAGGGDLALSSADTVFWELRPGLAPFVGEFTVDRARAEAWFGGTDETWASLEIDGRVFRRLRVQRGVQVDPHHVLVRVSDRRFRWKYVRFFGRHNLRRRVNEPLRTVDLLEAVEVELSEGAKRDDLSAILRERYRSWSVKADGSPYSCKELAVLVMRAMMLELEEEDALDEQSIEDAPDIGDIPDQNEFLGATPAEALGTLLQRAELQVAVDDDGTIRLYDPYLDPILPPVSTLRLKGGYYRKADMSRVRPAKIEVFAEVVRDRRIVYRATGVHATEALDDLTAESDPSQFLTCRMVLKLPFDEVFNGETLKVGSWVDFEDAISAWGVPLIDVRTLWFFGGEGLKYKYARRISSLGKVYYDPTWQRRIQAIMNSYLQTFQINPVYMDMVREWDATTVSIIDPVTRTAQPSPVYTVWAEMAPSTPLIAKNGPPDKVIDNLSSFTGLSDGQEFSLLPANYQVAPASISIEGDADLGVFRLSFLSAIDGSVAERIPGHVENPVNVFDEAVRKQVQLFTKNMKLMAPSDFRLEFVASFVEGAPNASQEHPLAHKDTFYKRIVKDPLNTGRVPKLMIFARAERARLDEYGKLSNATQIDAIMDGEARAAFKSFDDRHVGVPIFSHSASDDWKVTGHVRAIRFERKTDGATNVIFDASEPVIQANPIRGLPQSVRNYLQRVIPDQD